MKFLRVIFFVMLFAFLIVGAVFWNQNIYFIAFCIPACIFIGGLVTYLVRHKPGNILGVKTGISERNADTWEFANTYQGIKMMKWSVPLLIVSELVMLIVQPDAFIAELMAFLQIIPLFVISVSTEDALNKTFDYHGNRREIE